MKIYLFDFDGVLTYPKYFSEGLQTEYGIDKSFLDDFFKNDFPDCQLGIKDMKQALAPYLQDSGWKGTVDGLTDFWFAHDSELDTELLYRIDRLRESGNICAVATTQEKYRTAYIRKVMGLEDKFDALYVSCEMGIKKPNADFYAAAYDDLTQKYGLFAKSEITFYDDDARNVDAANAFGFHSMLYSRQTPRNIIS